MMIAPSTTIQKKRDGKRLDRKELKEFIQGICTGAIADYQATAFLMAIYFQGMSLDETVALTEAMLESGVRYDLSKIKGPKVDKHSTGGIGDKVSLILTPLAAACGLKVPMMAGRGLGHTGGTLDKLEAIPGFNIDFSELQFHDILSSIGAIISGQTEQIAPADKKLYALRDVTATVECIPLITASILSKKLAEGTEGLILDVKVGSGAFMKTQAEAKKLAKTLIQVAKKMNLSCRAILTGMNQPLGYSVGNAIEVNESLEILKGEKNNEHSSTDLKELTLQLCAQMLTMGGLCRNLAEAKRLAQDKLSDGSAWKVFQDLVRAQGGNLDSLSDGLPLASQKIIWTAKKRGYLNKMNTEEIGKILIDLGGGRRKASDPIDYKVGFAFHRKLGSKISAGDPLVTVYADAKTHLDGLEKRFQSALEIGSTRKATPRLILEQLN